MTLFNQRRLAEAESLALGLTRRFPSYGFAWKVLGVVLRLQGRGAESLAPLQRATELLPRDAESHNNLGAALKDQGRLLEAEASCLRALACDPVLTLAHSNLGAILKEQGRLAEAEASFRRVLVLTPEHAEAHNSLGAVLSAQNRLPEAQASFERAVELKPGFDKAHNNLGNALQRQGRPVEAEASYRRALKLSPGYAEAYGNLGACLRAQGRLTEAEASTRRSLAIQPSPDAHINLGVILQAQGRLSESEGSYREALVLAPDLATAHNNLGSALQSQGRLVEAEASYRRALERNPTYAEAYSNLGGCLQAQNRLSEAEASVLKAIDLAPDSVDAHTNLGVILQSQRRLAEAEASYRKALTLVPDYAKAHNNLGNILQGQGRLAEAEASCRRALRVEPDYVDALSNLAASIYMQGRLTEAEATIRRVLELEPDSVDAHTNLGVVLQAQGRLAEAEASFRRALELKPDLVKTHTNLLFCLSHRDEVSPEQLFAEHCRFGMLFEASLRAGWPRHGNDKDPDRCLQIGLVSGDLRTHAVAGFIEPVLAQLSTSSELLLHVYYNHTIDDNVTANLRNHVRHWHRIVGLADDVLAERIRTDGIDILIDLSGHTAHNRLLTFARKPAPLQVSWMGYPGTTGLNAMDYYLADHLFLPPGQFDQQFVERIVQLPVNAPFRALESAPPVSALPALTNGYVTFGSFNRLSKLNRSVVAMWARLLRALPDARLLIGAMPPDGTYSLTDWFEEERIAPERLSFHPNTGMDSYLGLHSRVDLCMDTFPYNGGTTTAHALWMGVPTLTLAGKTAPGRTGASILGGVGMEDFVARDADDFLQKGLHWAENLAALSRIRAELRDRFCRAPIGQAAVVATGLERALRTMWGRWCSDLPAESFRVSEEEAKTAG